MFTREIKYKQLIASYLTGNCTDAEQKRVGQLIGSSDSFNKLFDEYKTIWEHAKEPEITQNFDEKPAFAKISARIEEAEKPTIVIPIRKTKTTVIRKISVYAAQAAAVLLIALVSYFFLFSNQQPDFKTITTEIKIQEPLKLADGTLVYLNQGSTFVFPEDFRGSQRLVSLEGEAYFEVAHDEFKPFIITTGNLGIKVLGTSFNVMSFAGSGRTEVTIKSGKVLFYSFDPANDEILEQIVLSSGEKGIFDNQTAQLTRTNIQNSNCFAWKSGQLEFHNTPLAEVLDALERTYNLEFNTSLDISAYHLTARFDQDSAGDVLETLQIIFGFNISLSGNQVNIY
jgi:transmembrane sensor